MGKDLIKVITDPKVPLKELWTADDSELNAENASLVSSSTVRSAESMIGSDEPYIKINTIPISGLEEMILDETGSIPRIKVIFTDESGGLSGPNYPKNDPILSLYIKTQNPNLKPIRCDFLITSIKTNQDAVLDRDNIDRGSTFIMSGELFIPKIYDNVSKSYASLNSKDALKAIADEVGLGFADNEANLNDKMTWLNTNTSSLNFINHVTKHSYMDEDSFFTSFIDKYYHLTFVNVAEQLNPTHEIQYTYNNTVDGSAFEATQNLKDLKNDEQDEVLKLIGLTNLDGQRGQTDFIINYSLMGDTGRILKNKGFKKKIYYYDHSLDSDKMVSFFVNPVEIKGYKNDNKGLVPEDETLKESIVKKWMNIDYGNAHDQYNAAVLINDHNNSELNKVKLKVETAGINFQISRGSGIPIMIYTTGPQNMKKNFRRKDKNKDGFADTEIDNESVIPDDILTGRYYVSGIKYIYDKYNESFPYITQFQLARVNWVSENNLFE